MADAPQSDRPANEDATSYEDETLGRFLAQPAEHGYEDAPEPDVPIPPLSFRRRLHRFLYEKQPSEYSSIAPRRADGTRTKIFFFNGNGRGR
ncbi:MAG TPA: hypothetical protein VGG21_01410 [Acidimicrobiales bacterium]|jgi:hypothetical protein